MRASADSRPWSILAFLWIAFLINYVDRQVIFSILPVLEKELGFSNVQQGLAGSMFLWSYSVFMPFTGRLADRVRLELLLPASIVLWSLATLATGLSHSVGSLLFWRAVIGLTEAVYYPAAMATIGAVHSTATRSRAVAVHGSAQFAGIVAGGWFGGWSAETFGWRWGFAALAIVGILYAPVLRLGLGTLPARAPAGRSTARARDIFRDPCFRALLPAYFSLCAMVWMLYAWLPTFIYERFHLSLAQSGLSATLYLQTSAAAGILTGGALGDWISRRVRNGRFWIASAGLLICSPFAWLTFSADSLEVLKLASAACGFFSAIMTANIIPAAYDVVVKENYGLTAGVLTLIGGVAGGISVASIGQWKATLGTEFVSACVSSAAAFTALLLAAVVWQRSRTARSGDDLHPAGCDTPPLRSVSGSTGS